jgi:hypothetical protein
MAVCSRSPMAAGPRCGHLLSGPSPSRMETSWRATSAPSAGMGVLMPLNARAPCSRLSVAHGGPGPRLSACGELLAHGCACRLRRGESRGGAVAGRVDTPPQERRAGGGPHRTARPARPDRRGRDGEGHGHPLSGGAGRTKSALPPSGSRAHRLGGVWWKAPPSWWLRHGSRAAGNPLAGVTGHPSISPHSWPCGAGSVAGNGMRPGPAFTCTGDTTCGHASGRRGSSVWQRG